MSSSSRGERSAKLAARAFALIATFAVFVASGVTMAARVSAAPTIGCGSVIRASTTLHADVGPCLKSGLIITASNVTLDLGGHTVSGTFTANNAMPATNTAEAKGIVLNQVSGVTVTNGAVTHFAVGVRINGGSGNAITHLNIHDNIGGLRTDKATNGDGIALYASNGNLIDHDIVRHNGPWDGIGLLSHDGASGTDGASYNTITNNQILDNNVPMRVASGVISWKQDNGIAVTGPGSMHNLIDHNVIDGSSVNGVQIFPACINSYGGAVMGVGCAGTVPNDYNVITNNVVRNNGFGAPVATGPIGDGILILSMGPKGIFEPGHETVENNVTSGNLRNGISIGGGNGEDLYNNNNDQGGIYGCSNITPSGNPSGVPTDDLCGSNDNNVSYNTSYGNGEDGIYVGPKSKFNTVDGNHVFDNRRDGIAVALAVVYNSSGQAVSNGQGGFLTVAHTAATNNTFDSNTGIGDGRWDGRDDNPGCGNTWQDNQFGSVNQPCVSG